MRRNLARTFSGLAISLLALTATVNPLWGTNVGLTFSQGTCNVVIVEGDTCTVTFTLTNIDPVTNINNPLNMYLQLVSITSSAGGNLALPSGEDPASIQPGGFNNPCVYPGALGGGNPAIPGGMCSETVTITTDVGGDGEPPGEKADFGTTTFTAVWRGLTLAGAGGLPSANSAQAQFSVIVVDRDFPPPPPNDPPAPTVFYLPEPSTFSAVAVGFLWLAARLRRRRASLSPLF